MLVSLANVFAWLADFIEFFAIPDSCFFFVLYICPADPRASLSNLVVRHWCPGGGSSPDRPISVDYERGDAVQRLGEGRRAVFVFHHRRQAVAKGVMARF